MATRGGRRGQGGGFHHKPSKHTTTTTTARDGEPARTASRLAVGREKTLTAGDHEPLWMRVALDAVARHRAAGEPLDRVLAGITKERHLGPRERRSAGDALFSWARLKTALESAADDAVKAYGGTPPRRRDVDRVLLAVAAASCGVDEDIVRLAQAPDALQALVEDAAARGPAAVVAGKVALPAPLVARLRAAYGEDADALIQALGRPAPLVVAYDARVVDEARVIEAIAKQGARATPSPVVKGALRVEGRVHIAKLAEDVKHAVWPMDDGSQLVARAVGARAGERILDLCAGGGGKSKLLAASGAHVVAVDVSAARLAVAVERAWPDVVAGVRADGRAPPFSHGRFDRVLVDAPCTGTGTLRRAPDLASRLDDETIGRFPALQRALLSAACDLVAPGGVVLYATCSLLPEENGDVVDEVLRGRRDVEPCALGPLLVGDARIDVPGGASRLSLSPAVHGTDGFFLAAMTKRAAG